MTSKTLSQWWFKQETEEDLGAEPCPTLVALNAHLRPRDVRRLLWPVSDRAKLEEEVLELFMEAFEDSKSEPAPVEKRKREWDDGEGEEAAVKVGVAQDTGACD